MEKLRIAIIGCGAFARAFVPLFKAHPYVEKVYVCDLVQSKVEDYVEKFNVSAIGTFEEALAREDINAVAIFTERHKHGPMVIAALRAGKHVYSAVPMASSVEDCGEIIKAVKETGKVYMMGETCIYYPCAMFCKQEYEKGTFGKFIFAEAQYFHDLAHFSDYFRANRPTSAVPPFLYPTHSTGMVLWATGAHVTKVSAVGYVDTEENTPFAVGENPWDNVFSNEFALMQLSCGGAMRIAECRRIGHKAPSSSISGFYGTRADYQFHNAEHLVTVNHGSGREVELLDVSDQVNPRTMTAAKEAGVANFKTQVANHVYQWNSPSPIQDAEFARLPKEYSDEKLPNGHMASHQLLIDDFCTAAYHGRMPRVNAWLAARFTVPGLVAHESAKLGGVLLDVPDFGDAPETL